LVNLARGRIPPEAMSGEYTLVGDEDTKELTVHGIQK
jgi:hypothetical protein